MNHELEGWILFQERMKAVDMVVITMCRHHGMQVRNVDAELVKVAHESGDGALAAAIDENGLGTEDEVAIRTMAVRIFRINNKDVT
jgi:hypothetical protein